MSDNDLKDPFLGGIHDGGVGLSEDKSSCRGYLKYVRPDNSTAVLFIPAENPVLLTYFKEKYLSVIENGLKNRIGKSIDMVLAWDDNNKWINKNKEEDHTIKIIQDNESTIKHIELTIERGDHFSIAECCPKPYTERVGDQQVDIYCYLC